MGKLAAITALVCALSFADTASARELELDLVYDVEVDGRLALDPYWVVDDASRVPAHGIGVGIASSIGPSLLFGGRLEYGRLVITPDRTDSADAVSAIGTVTIRRSFGHGRTHLEGRLGFEVGGGFTRSLGFATAFRDRAVPVFLAAVVPALAVRTGRLVTSLGIGYRHQRTFAVPEPGFYEATVGWGYARSAAFGAVGHASLRTRFDGVVVRLSLGVRFP